MFIAGIIFIKLGGILADMVKTGYICEVCGHSGINRREMVRHEKTALKGLEMHVGEAFAYLHAFDTVEDAEYFIAAIITRDLKPDIDHARGYEYECVKVRQFGNSLCEPSGIGLKEGYGLGPEIFYELPLEIYKVLVNAASAHENHRISLPELGKNYSFIQQLQLADPTFLLARGIVRVMKN